MSSAQIKSHVAELTNLKDQFNTLSNQSSEKLKKIIQTVQSYQTRMEPLNKNMEQLQILQRNLESCRLKLNQAMERIKDALAYFQENNPQDVEFSRLTSLYSIGLGSLEREFDGLLRQTFRPMNDATLIRLMDQKVPDKESGDGSVTGNIEQVEDIPNDMLNSLRFLAKWMNENQSFMNKQQGVSQGCLTKYCECRRELIRVNLMRVRALLRKSENPSAPTTVSKPGFLPPNVRGRTKRLPGFVWDLNAVRLINETETDELDSEHYAISLDVLVKLMQNERVLLERLQLTANPQDSQVLLFNIFKSGSSDILAEGTTLTRLMHRAQGRAEFHMIMSLLVVLKKFFQISNELLSVLQGVDNVLVDFNQLVLRLLSQSKTTLETYVQFLQQVAEKPSSSNTIVPTDGTIHELTTNALMYLENLLEFSDIIGTTLSFTEAGPQSTANTLKYLNNIDRDKVFLDHRFGNYLFNALFALLTNLERKSEVYSEEIRRMIFQMNNIQYILKKQIFTVIFYRKIEKLSLNLLASWTNIDQKEKSSLKSLWNDFNNGLNTLTKQHHLVSIPDRELRHSLEHQLVRDLVPMYRGFWEKSTSITFTTNRDKYIKLSVEEFEMRIRQLFNNGTTNSTLLYPLTAFSEPKLMDIFSCYRKDDLPFVRISAPMVRYTKLPFRLLLRQHSVDLVHTPMILANSFIRSEKARNIEFTTCSSDRPLIVQLASNDPCEFTIATEMVAPYCDGVDLNCGCPQSWAMNSGLGSALLREPEKIANIIHAARNTIPRWRNSNAENYEMSNDNTIVLNNYNQVENKFKSITRLQGPFSVSAKIRIPTACCRSVGEGSSCDPIKLTVELVRRLAVMGADWVTLHARTPQQRSRDSASWNMVQELVDCKIKHSYLGTDIPIILNGDVHELKDAYCAHETTGCHGVMVGRALLKSPYLFAPNYIKDDNSPCHLFENWLLLSTQYTGGTNFATVHQQAYWMMEPFLDKTNRLILHSIGSFPGLVDWLFDHRKTKNS
ncbi:tRNA-dihydrouridine(20a/20b) synthase [NAD(P)+]-like [Schistosoma japonicum]|nr:tRNA-dihydrouridine(20a/20b) synthase [NAD(P)+]-like [Schistosoma japonicum]